ncbi:MAG: phage scaffolding protein, partial [Ruminiclostridium sp.]|nr:phage scaffolding protein [Ruminiclostridium sp.]
RYKPVADFEALNSQLADRDKQLEALGKVKPEDLQDEIKRLKDENETTAKKFAAEIAAFKLNGAIENRLLKEGAVNTKAVRALLDNEKIKLGEDGSLTGLDEQIKTLRESEKWAFAQPAKQVPGSGGNPAPAEEPKKQPLPSGTVIF